MSVARAVFLAAASANFPQLRDRCVFCCFSPELSFLHSCCSFMARNISWSICSIWSICNICSIWSICSSEQVRGAGVTSLAPVCLGGAKTMFLSGIVAPGGARRPAGQVGRSTAAK